VDSQKSQVVWRRQQIGGAENDGHENDGPSKCPDMKLTDMKMQDMFQIQKRSIGPVQCRV